MNGRLESKIKIEKRTLESIKNSGYNLTSFFNSLAAKYEASSKETYITYIINFLKAMNKPVSEITSDEINNYFIDLTLEDYDEMLASLKKCTSSYQITMYTALKEFSNYLKAAKINMDDPMQYKKRPKFKESKETH